MEGAAGATANQEMEKTMSTYQNVQDGKYKNTMPYPARVVEPAVLRKSFKEMTTDERKMDLNAIQAKYDADQAAYKQAVRDWNAKTNELEDLFRKDLEAEHGMTGHPKADLLYSKAYERGHSSGMGEVASVYEDLVDLVL